MKIAAHLIVGARDEPFLGALLASLEGAVEMVAVNDNSGSSHSANVAILEASSFARNGRLIVDRSPFVDFSSARNRLLTIHRERNLGEWVAFVDADEVHGPAIARIAGHLGDIPPHIAYVDGYTYHFLQSFDWYTSIERRMMFFRFTPALRWEGTVHERLTGSDGARLAVPYVYHHYGHVLPVRRHAEKARQYASLGAPGEVATEEQLQRLDRAAYFAPLWPLALPYRATHPPAALATVRTLRERYAADYSETDRIIPTYQSAMQRFNNAVRRVNFAFRWRGRMLDPHALRMLR